MHKSITTYDALMNLTEPKNLVGVTAPLVPGHDVKVPHALERALNARQL